MGRNGAPQSHNLRPISAQLAYPKCVSGVYAVADEDVFLAPTALSESVVLALPAAASTGVRELRVFVTSLAGGTVTAIPGVATDTINGGASYTFATVSQLYVLICDGTAWRARKISNDIDPRAPDLHASTHVKGGTDEIDPLHTRFRLAQLLAVTGSTTPVNLGFSAAPTIVNGPATFFDHPEGGYLSHTTAASTGATAGMLTSFAEARSDREPDVVCQVRTPGSLSNARLWAGLFSADPSGSSGPTTHVGAFTFDATVDSGSVFWQAYTADGTTGNRLATTAAIAGGGAYTLRWRFRSGHILFYVNNLLVADKTTNLPASTQLIGGGVMVTALANSAKSFLWSRFSMLT